MRKPEERLLDMGMRHILVHDYFQIDLEIVWAVVEKELPALKEQLQKLVQI